MEQLFPYQKGINILRGQSQRLAVMELSSRACKLIAFHRDDLAHGFQWSSFQSETDLTHFGQYILNGELSMPIFEDHIWPVIAEKFVRAKAWGVDVLLAVSTSPLRQTELREPLLDFMRGQGLRVHVMTPHEETEATYAGFVWAQENKVASTSLFVDQGGASTEISLIESGRLMDSLAFPFGTLNSVVCFQQYLEVGETVSEALRHATQDLQSQLQMALRSWKPSLKASMMTAIGTAMTNLCGGMPREERHGRTWNMTEAQQALDDLYQRLSNTEQASWLNSKENMAYTPLEKQLHTYLGLSMLLTLSQQGGVSEIVVNGVGMRYGLCAQLLNLYRLMG